VINTIPNQPKAGRLGVCVDMRPAGRQLLQSEGCQWCCADCRRRHQRRTSGGRALPPGACCRGPPAWGGRGAGGGRGGRGGRGAGGEAPLVRCGLTELSAASVLPSGPAALQEAACHPMSLSSPSLPPSLTPSLPLP
jgi:hypothetical protein